MIVDNIECRGEFVVEQAEYCHYETTTRSICPPPPNIILSETNVTAGDGSDYCHCVFELGKTVCRSCKYISIDTIRCLKPSSIVFVM